MAADMNTGPATANQIRVEAELLRLADLLDKENQLGEAEDDGVRRLAEEVVRLKEDEDCKSFLSL